ncbi:hypothetical protein DFH07DRAFT_969351 [Mycena maculata]|uniref:Uncharacterized protein n=1 Tax=Mycena maculata TaxID=230809 RepID=A0AAD7HWE4_9AGAR|nr:hypothetical protein DFH07DRAFT_969351 [Mycena maculata]
MSTNRAGDPSRSINVSSPILLLQLNQLLASLDLPITVESSRELTPSMLICILESMLSLRLPISAQERESLFSSENTKIHCMKIFLGVLQADVLKQDVGLSSVNPRRLARGEDEETIFIGRLLCWYGRWRGLIAREPGRKGTLRDESESVSTLMTRTETVFSSAHRESNTSAGSLLQSESAVTAAAATRPRCIHEVPSPSVLSPATPHTHLEMESSLATNATVRYTGYIERVDEDAEIAAFEAQRRRRPQAQAHTHESQRVPTTTTLERGLELRRQKADMLEELARLEVAEYTNFVRNGGG